MRLSMAQVEMQVLNATSYDLKIICDVCGTERKVVSAPREIIDGGVAVLRVAGCTTCGECDYEHGYADAMNKASAVQP